MNIQEKQVLIRKLEAGEGMIITKISDPTFRSKLIYLGCEDDLTDYVEIDENTPTEESEEE